MSCALCGGESDVAALPVPPTPDAVQACGTCRGQLASGQLDPRHWRCLQESIWSEDAAVQIVSWRALQRIPEPWATDLLEQVYLDEAVLAAAQAEVSEASEAKIRVVDAHGAELLDGDTVTLIKDLDVKGGGFTAKRGTVVKNIRLGDDPELVEGRVNGTAIYLKTIFLKKAPK